MTAGSGGGVRWYELRNPSTTPTVFQQGTYAPDSSFRWMSSIAMDGAGDIALGFSVSSSSISPSIRYTGRVPTDAAGTMGQGEGTIITGAGAQTGNLSRWGDYSSMNIDPTDDCTFWFTEEYMARRARSAGTRASALFKFPNCGTTTNDFTITPTRQQTVAAGGSTLYAINTTVLSGTAQMINLIGERPPAASPAASTRRHHRRPAARRSRSAATTAAAGTTQFMITGTGAAARANRERVDHRDQQQRAADRVDHVAGEQRDRGAHDHVNARAATATARSPASSSTCRTARA